MNEFENKFKNFQTIDLLKIVKNHSDYQPLAVETAKKEIQSRNLSKEEINNLTNHLESKKNEQLLRNKKTQDITRKIKGYFSSTANTLSPIQNSKTPKDRLVDLITLIFLGFVIYRLYRNYGILWFMFTSPSTEWDIGMVGYIVPFIFLPTTIFLFWKRKTIGWSLLAIFLTFSTVNSIGIYIVTLKQQSYILIGDLFDQNSPVTYIYKLIFFGGALWGITRSAVLDKFKISKRKKNKIIGITGIITTLIIVLFFFTV